VRHQLTQQHNPIPPHLTATLFFAEQAESALKISEEAVEHAKKDFETVSARVLNEVKRFKKDKAEDMKKTVMDYINLQIEYNKRMEEIWEKMIPSLEIGNTDAAQDTSIPNDDRVRTNSELNPPKPPVSDDLVGV